MCDNPHGTRSERRPCLREAVVVVAEVVEAVAEETSEAEEEEAAEAGISGAAGEGAAGVTSGEEEVAAGAVGAGASAGHRKMLAFATFRAFTSECCAVLVQVDFLPATKQTCWCTLVFVSRLSLRSSCVSAAVHTSSLCLF